MNELLFALTMFILGVSLNAFFAGYETGFVASNTIRVRYLAEKERRPSALRLLAYLEQPDRMITLVLVGTNVALVMGTMAITRQLGSFWATVIATPMFLVFGEIVPKSMFRIHPTRLSLGLLPVIRFFDALLAPVVVPVAWLSQRFLALVKEEQRDIRVLMSSLEDVRTLVDESADHGTIDEGEREMIHSVMDLQQTQANEIMQPRIEIQALPASATRTELLELLEKTGRTRIPIYEGSIDRIVGIVNAFDVLTDATPDNQDITRFIREVIHVPDTIKLDDLLKTMRDAKQHMAIVVDEYGGVDGLVTIEDILEEILGEIRDEYDKDEATIRRVGPDAWVVNARVELEAVSEMVGVPVTDEEVETVGGWVMRVLGRIPNKGEVFDHGPFRITVLDSGPNFVSSVRLELLPRE